MSRASWDEYFMRIAENVASRATCDRKHVGAVIVRDKSILATGSRNGVRIDGATIYVTASPCWGCFKMIVQAGILRILYHEPYREGDPAYRRVCEMADMLNLELKCS